jgi:hypothetical protein
VNYGPLDANGKWREDYKLVANPSQAFAPFFLVLFSAKEAVQTHLLQGHYGPSTRLKCSHPGGDKFGSEMFPSGF